MITGAALEYITALELNAVFLGIVLRLQHPHDNQEINHYDDHCITGVVSRGFTDTEKGTVEERKQRSVCVCAAIRITVPMKIHFKVSLSLSSVSAKKYIALAAAEWPVYQERAHYLASPLIPQETLR